MQRQLMNAVNRITNLEWENIGHLEKASNMALIKEYLRRAASLIQENSLNAKYPFFDAADAINKTPKVDLDKICPHLLKANNIFIKRICECYLKWAILVDEKVIVALKYFDLYEPLILLFERGGTVGMHHGDIITGGGALPLPNINYMALQEPIDISDSNLDEWDR